MTVYVVLSEDGDVWRVYENGSTAGRVAKRLTEDYYMAIKWRVRTARLLRRKRRTPEGTK